MTSRRRIALLVTGLSVAALAVAFIVLDAGLRSFAETRIEREITDSLPAGTTGDITASVNGGSVIGQLLSGSFAEVELRSEALTIAVPDSGDVTVSVHLVATGVPVDTSAPIGQVSADVDFSQQALDALLENAAPGAGSTGPLAEARQGGELLLGEGVLAYTGTLQVPGFPIDYEAVATPTTTPDSLVLTPSDAQLTTPAGSLELGGLLPLILGQPALTVCLAGSLPAGVSVTGVDVTSDRARLSFEAKSLLLTEDALSSRGSCTAP
jgi:hypothetical protein